MEEKQGSIARLVVHVAYSLIGVGVIISQLVVPFSILKLIGTDSERTL